MNSDSTDYRKVLGRVEGMRRGFTTGTCAQAASLAAAKMLIDGKTLTEVTISLKDNRRLTIPVVNAHIGTDHAECGVIKDAGDDEDVTNGVEVHAAVSYIEQPGVNILGGQGIGKVTKKGLPVAPGEAAINPNPRKQIIRALAPLKQNDRGFQVLLTVPEGEKLAKSTWNPRLGIEGGISIIGTTGVVEPKSSAAFKASIALNLNILKKSDQKTAALAFGYVGENWYSRRHGWGQDMVIKFADHFGYTLDMAASKGFARIVLAGHVGKMVKVAAGLFDTHWTSGDARLETVAAWAGVAGADRATIKEILTQTSAEAAVAILDRSGLNETWKLINNRLLERCRLRLERGGFDVVFESVLLNLEGRELAHEEI